MILFGASGHAKVIIDILEKSGEVIDFLIDANPELTSLLGYKVYTEDRVPEHNQPVIISIGNNAIRKRIAHRLPDRFGTAIHPLSVVDERALIGKGTVVMANAVINSSVHIGDHCIINTSASVDHDCKIGSFVHISPGATLCGGISIGEGSQIGAGATVIPNLTIGKGVIVGAGAVIIRDIPDGAVVVGNPGRIIKTNDVEE